MSDQLYQCPCCGQNTLEEDYEDSYEVCPECGWEREQAYELEPDNPLAGCANGDISLNEARSYWREHHSRVPKIPFHTRENL
jgi:hypothetical protein